MFLYLKIVEQIFCTFGGATRTICSVSIQVEPFGILLHSDRSHACCSEVLSVCCDLWSSCGYCRFACYCLELFTLELVLFSPLPGEMPWDISTMTRGCFRDFAWHLSSLQEVFSFAEITALRSLLLFVFVIRLSSIWRIDTEQNLFESMGDVIWVSIHLCRRWEVRFGWSLISCGKQGCEQGFFYWKNFFCPRCHPGSFFCWLL